MDDVGRAAPVRHPAAGLVQLSGAATAVLETIRSAGGHPYLVGGCVRDALLAPGRRPAGVDIEVFGLEPDLVRPDLVRADLVRAALARVGRWVEFGRSFAVLKVRRDGEDVDVSVPRPCAERGGAPVAGPDTPPAVAARRRDYTVNALMFDPMTEEVLDVVGGVRDCAPACCGTPARPSPRTPCACCAPSSWPRAPGSGGHRRRRSCAAACSPPTPAWSRNASGASGGRSPSRGGTSAPRWPCWRSPAGWPPSRSWPACPACRRTHGGIPRGTR
jgi:hypothetical protein